MIEAIVLGTSIRNLSAGPTIQVEHSVFVIDRRARPSHHAVRDRVELEDSRGRQTAPGSGILFRRTSPLILTGGWCGLGPTVPSATVRLRFICMEVIHRNHPITTARLWPAAGNSTPR